MSGKIHVPSFVITLGLVAISIYLCYNLMVLNTDYGSYHGAILVLAIAVLGITLMMVAGCYARYMEFSQEDLEKIGDSAQKK